MFWYNLLAQGSIFLKRPLESQMWHWKLVLLTKRVAVSVEENEQAAAASSRSAQSWRQRSLFKVQKKFGKNWLMDSMIKKKIYCGFQLFPSASIWQAILKRFLSQFWKVIDLQCTYYATWLTSKTRLEVSNTSDSWACSRTVPIRYSSFTLSQLSWKRDKHQFTENVFETNLFASNTKTALIVNYFAECWRLPF